MSHWYSHANLEVVNNPLMESMEKWVPLSAWDGDRAQMWCGCSVYMPVGTYYRSDCLACGKTDECERCFLPIVHCGRRSVYCGRCNVARNMAIRITKMARRNGWPATIMYLLDILANPHKQSNYWRKRHEYISEGIKTIACTPAFNAIAQEVPRDYRYAALAEGLPEVEV